MHRHTPDRILRGYAPRLAELRRAAGLSQEQLGFRAGVRQATISDPQAYLKGRSDDLYMKAHTLAKEGPISVRRAGAVVP